MARRRVGVRMRDTLKIAAAIVGVIVGAGFASGQEIFQFFTSFGKVGVFGGVIAAIAFAFIFTQVARLGNIQQTTSHKKVIDQIAGPYLGKVLDLIITFFLFGVLVIMIAGSGSLFEQQFGIPKYIGSAIMTILTIATVYLNMKNILSLLATFTPVLLIVITFLGIYSTVTTDLTAADVSGLVDVSKSAAPHWILGAALYVSYVTAAGFAMLTVIGGSTKDSKVIIRGGILGGLTLGFLIILFQFAMIGRFDIIQSVDMPTLLLAKEVSPWLGYAMAILILGMIYNTAVGMLYSFTARFSNPSHPKFKVLNTVVGVVAFLASFAGFTKLVGTLYPITGYLGFILIAAIVISAFRMKAIKKGVKAEKLKEENLVIADANV